MRARQRYLTRLARAAHRPINQPATSVASCHGSSVCCGGPKLPSPFWVRASSSLPSSIDLGVDRSRAFACASGSGARASWARAVAREAARPSAVAWPATRFHLSYEAPTGSTAPPGFTTLEILHGVGGGSSHLGARTPLPCVGVKFRNRSRDRSTIWTSWASRGRRSGAVRLRAACVPMLGGRGSLRNMLSNSGNALRRRTSRVAPYMGLTSRMALGEPRGR